MQITIHEFNIRCDKAVGYDKHDHLKTWSKPTTRKNLKSQQHDKCKFEWQFSQPVSRPMLFGGKQVVVQEQIISNFRDRLVMKEQK
jgi:hypothetical protein